MMQPSLFVEQQGTGTAFYIDGELQFHSADERIYHEYLVIPALALARQRFRGAALRVLICGGGDGLAAREVLRFPEVAQVDLVDYDPAVIELAQTEFASFNEHSLEQPQVRVHIQEAFAFLEQQVNSVTSDDQIAPYHVILCDFTYPVRQEYTDIYAQEWFSLLKLRLMPEGLLAVNGFSPNHNTMAFWCLYQTIRAAQFHCLPMWLDVPSFTNHDYGYWGFMLASPGMISRDDLADWELPEDLQTLTTEGLYQSFCLPVDLVQYLPMARVHCQGSSQLFFYLLNRKALGMNRNLPDSLEQIILDAPLKPDLSSNVTNSSAIVDFLDYEPTDLPQESDSDPLATATLAQEWLHLAQQHLNSLTTLATTSKSDDNAASDSPLPSLDALPLPVQHFYHTPEMMHLWRERLQYLLNHLDWRQLLEKLQERRTDLPADDIARLERIYTNMAAMESVKSSVPLDADSAKTSQIRFPEIKFAKINLAALKFPEITLSELATATRTVTLVGLILLLANTVAPDAAFAKGGFFGISTGSSGGGNDDGGGFFSWGMTGFWLTVGGVIWLNSLAEEERKEREARNHPPDDEE
ncbi:MAG: hypothetical protein WCO45_14560 [Pseudanabaena sp. ELA607]